MLMRVRKIDLIADKDESGEVKNNPVTKRPVLKRKVVDESIDVHLIKGIRPFHRKGNEMNEVKELDGKEISIFYMKPSPGEERHTPELRVVGNWEEHTKEVNRLRGYRELNSSDSLPTG